MCVLEKINSHSGLNLKVTEGEYDISLSELMLRPLNMIRQKMHRHYNDSSSFPGDEWIISVILELMDCKRWMRTCGLNYHEVCAVLESACIHTVCYVLYLIFSFFLCRLNLNK